MKTFIRRNSVIFLVMVILVTLIACENTDNINNHNHNQNNKLNVTGEITWSVNERSEEEKLKYKAFVDAFEKEYPEAKVNLDFSMFGCRHSSGTIGDVLTISSVVYYSDSLMPFLF